MAELGNVKIANEVVGIIAGIAATEVEGVYAMTGTITDGLTNILGKKNFSKGVKVDVGEKECSIDVNLKVEYGARIPEVSAQVQKNIIDAVGNMTGLKVVEVNIFIQDIHMQQEEVEELKVEETDIQI